MGKSSRSDDTKGQFYAHMSETTIGTKKTSYSEKVAVLAKETTFHNDGSNGDPMTGNHNSDEPSSTAMVSVDDESVQDDDGIVQGEVVSSQIITSRSRTVETTPCSCEKDGETETKVEQKVTIQSDGEPIDHDEALAQAIQEATAMNPDMTVEKIEIHQTTQADSL